MVLVYYSGVAGKRHIDLRRVGLGRCAILAQKGWVKSNADIIKHLDSSPDKGGSAVYAWAQVVPRRRVAFCSLAWTPGTNGWRPLGAV